MLLIKNVNILYMEFKILPLYPIFILLLIISSNFLAELFPCKLQELLGQNIFLKHFFAYLTLIFFVSITIKNVGSDVYELITNSLVLYLYFIILIKSDVYFFVIICFILAILYLGHIQIDLIKNKKDKTETEKMFLEVYEKRKNKFGIETILHYLLILFLILGCLTYMGEKKLEYKSKFNYFTFFFGKTICKNKSPNTNVYKSLKNAFN